MPTHRATCLPQEQPSPGLSYPPASPHHLPTTTSGPRLPGKPVRRPERRLVVLVSVGSAWARVSGYGNINPLSIDYASRPRLRSRLTLGGLACPRNPWSSGGGVSHPSFATHACILTRVASTAGSLRCFPCHTTLPYPPAHLDPKGARGRSPSSRDRSHGDLELPSSLTIEGRDIARVSQLRRCA